MAPPVASATRSPPSEPSAEKTATISQRRVPKQSKPHVPPQTKAPISNNQQSQQKKPHRQPIIDWFQRKLGGTAKGKRSVDENISNRNGRVIGAQRAGSRVVSSPVATPGGRQQAKLDTTSAATAAARRKTVSLNEDSGVAAQNARHSDDSRDENSSINDSIAQESVWGPNSVQEADEDASLRPLPPSSPPSPSPSRSSSSYLSDPRTFKSIAASTKPTTLLSIDLHGNGMAHIAQAPLTPIRFSHARSSSTTTNPPTVITGVAPPSPQTSSRPSSVQDILNTTSVPSNNTLVVQAPLHTTHHPRNNPRPLSPPLDDASLLTLASSAYAIPGLRVGVSGTQGWSSPSSAIGGGGDSMSHFGAVDVDAESTSQLAIDDERLDDRDADASLRALRPRSTRRGSWESEASRWSARIQITGPPSLGRERSLWTTNSIRTGEANADNVEAEDQNEEEEEHEEDEDEEAEDQDEGVEDDAPHSSDESKPTVPEASAETGGNNDDSETTVVNEETPTLPKEPAAGKVITTPIDQNHFTEAEGKGRREAEDKGKEQEKSKVELEERDEDANHAEPNGLAPVPEAQSGAPSPEMKMVQHLGDDTPQPDSNGIEEKSATVVQDKDSMANATD